VRYWLHAEHLIVNGEKMSKSLGNFYTLRDLLAQGYKPSAIRYLLAAVPYRRHLNFTFEGLHQAEQSIERLRNFRLRLTQESFPAGENTALIDRARAACQALEDAMDDNLNTAEALGAVFAMVRDANTAIDRGEFRAGDRAAFLETLERWDRIFAVLEDNDNAKLRQYGFIKEATEFIHLAADIRAPEGAEATIAGNGHGGAPLVGSLSDEEIGRSIEERNEMRRKGNYARADEIRQNLQKAGVMLEDSKAGTRWKRK
jgi:cysteinyl-tRNA synthetase